MNKTLEKIFEKVEQYDSIVVFGHKNPDGDCIGSVYGLYYALKEYYPNKKIYKVGSVPLYLEDFKIETEEVTDDIIRSSLAFMVDLSDLERVEDQRILDAKEIVCIDHHIQSKKPSFLVYREVDAASATVILTKVLLRRYKSLPKISAYYFYLGLMTDSSRFQFDSEKGTLMVASKLISYGIDYKDMYRKLYKQSLVSLRYKAFIYSNIKFDGLVSYCVIRKEDYQQFGFTSNTASGQVNLLSNLDDHPMWVIFTENEEGRIRVELRSNSLYNVQQVAIKFGGGGHLAASGCQLDSFSQVKAVLKEMNKAIKIC